MKRFVSLIAACLFLSQTFAQTSSLALATDKTTSLIFPFSIRHVDRGTKDVLVQQVKEAGNILLLKAATQQFKETNLSVITEDGSVYTFLVCYAADPSSFIWHIPVQHDATLATYCNGILDNQQTMHGISDHSWNMLARVIGIYIKGNVIYYQLKLENQSPVDYDIELLKFYIRDKRKSKRTAVQENE
ncbi:MAG: DUF4138 domain-containing protein, partial [Bacteroidetes bacterium]|nr:DUF4138 domain-containing protein [Bacteroidota bacterium]